MRGIKSGVGVFVSICCWIYILLIAGLLPFYYTEGYGYIGSDKAKFLKNFGYPVLLWGLVGLLLYLVLELFISLKGKTKAEIWQWIKSRVSVTDVFVLCYALVVVISYLSTDYKELAWYGHEKWPNGLVPHLVMVVSYFIVSRFLAERNYLLALIRVVPALVFVLAILDRMEIRPLDMEYGSYWFISTIGNINWFCGYWSVVAWVPIISYWNREVQGKKKNVSRLPLIGDGILSALAIFTCLIQGSDSGVLAMVAVFFFLFCLSVENGDRMQRLFELVIMTCIACFFGYWADWIWAREVEYESWVLGFAVRSVFPWLIGIVCGVIYFFLKKINRVNLFPLKKAQIVKKCLLGTIIGCLVLYFLLAVLNTMLPSGLGPLYGQGLFTFDEMWGSQRGGTWGAAFRAWWDQDIWHKLVGVGPDSMWSYITGGANPALYEMVNEQFPNQRLLNAHGEWITNLINLGVLGAVSFAGFQVSFVRRCFRRAKSNVVFYIFGFIGLSYVLNNIFSFQTVINLSHIFIMMGAGENMLRSEAWKNDRKKH